MPSASAAESVRDHLIDFINMEEEEDKKELLKILQGYLRKDR